MLGKKNKNLRSSGTDRNLYTEYFDCSFYLVNREHVAISFLAVY